MNLIGITINHRTASIETREALHLNQEETVYLIDELKKDVFAEGIVLSTCNRTEIFGFPYKEGTSTHEIYNRLTKIKSVEGLQPNLFQQFFSCGAAKHICEVATGIDSLILGDSQILSQVKSAFSLADDLNFTNTITRRMAETVIHTGKRAIRETMIGEGAVTISYAAIQVVEKIFANLEKKSALVIGAGETGELAAIHLRDKQIGNIVITNRTISRAEYLAKKVDGNVLPFENYKNHLHEFDVIVSATSSDEILISKKEILKVMRKRRGAPLCLMDIALPRDIDAESQKIDNVFYHDIDSLNIIVDKNLDRRKEEIPKIKHIINEELIGFFSWYNTLDIVPTIKSFRSFFEEIRDDELRKIKNKLNDDEYQKVEAMAKRIVGRILHNPTIKLKNLAESGVNLQEASSSAHFLKDLFKLNGVKDEENNEQTD